MYPVTQLRKGGTERIPEFCVTYDFDSEEDGAVTVRDRDTMQQERIKIDELDAYFEKKFEF